VPHSIIDAIKQGVWDYEPATREERETFDATAAMPGTEEKLGVLAARIEQGLPLWHPSDRRTFDDGEN
jgi:hypothetical protein